MSQQLSIPKSEILFLYESKYNTPNGDPFTGEQRYDDQTKKILISDVRIKRYIRDYFIETSDQDIYVLNDPNQIRDTKMSGAAARMKWLKEKYKEDESVLTQQGKKQGIDAKKVMQKCIDVRLFGGISTEEKDAVNLTGPVQFGLLNPSLTSSELRMHQNTSVFSSDVASKSRGAIGTTTLVPYALNQIHGWINPFSARYTDLEQSDLNLMFQALWESVNNINTRSKANQDSLLLIQIVYTQPTKKLYGVDQLITLESDKREEEIRSRDEYQLNFDKLIQASQKEIVQQINFYTEDEKIQSALNGQSKFNEVKELWTAS